MHAAGYPGAERLRIAGKVTNITQRTPTPTTARDTANPVSENIRKSTVPNYDLSKYPFKGVPKPFKHQVETMQFMLDRPRCFVWNDLGTGKSWSAVWAIDHLMQIGEVKNVLIVAPLSTLDIVWRRTFFHLNAALDVQILKGTVTQKLHTLNREPNMLGFKVSIINPDSLHTIAGHIEDYQMVVVDESALFRNSQARRTKALTHIAKSIPRIVCMTGSPMPEAPTDVYSTARIICPDRVPRYFSQFRDMVMRKISQFKWVALPSAQQTISNLLSGYVIRFKRDECIDLPPSQEYTYELTPTLQQKKALTEMRKAAIALFEDGQCTAPNEAVVVSKMLQICSGAVKFQNDQKEHSVKDIDCKTKLEALTEIIEASEQPVIVYAPYTAAISKLVSYCEKMSYSVRCVDGSVTPEKRKEAFDALQAGTVRVLVCHPQAVAHGLTLTNANVIVWFCPVFSHEIFEQANGRIVRPGQVRKTYIVSLVCSALEKKVLTRLQAKAKLQGSLLEYLQRADV